MSASNDFCAHKTEREIGARLVDLIKIGGVFGSIKNAYQKEGGSVSASSGFCTYKTEREIGTRLNDWVEIGGVFGGIKNAYQKEGGFIPASNDFCLHKSEPEIDMGRRRTNRSKRLDLRVTPREKAHVNRLAAQERMDVRS